MDGAGPHPVLGGTVSLMKFDSCFNPVVCIYGGDYLMIMIALRDLLLCCLLFGRLVRLLRSTYT